MSREPDTNLDKSSDRGRSMTTLLIVIMLIVIVISGVLLFGALTRPTFAQTNSNCNGDALVDRNLPTNSQWDFCWQHDANAGIVLTDIFYTTPTNLRRQILDEASLAQIHIPFDDNSARLHLVSDAGLGGDNLLALDQSDCADGQLLAHAGKNVVCVRLDYRDYLYKHYSTQKSGFVLQFFSVSQVDEQLFIVEWNFLDDGTIEPAVGATGQLAAVGTNSAHGWPIDSGGSIGVGQTNNYYWRLDFELGENGPNEIIEEIEAVPTTNRERKELAVLPILNESARSQNADVKRRWRIRDAALTNSDSHFISYEINPQQSAHNYTGTVNEPFTQNDIYFTKTKGCERFVSHNSTSGGCGADVTQFVDGEGINSADITIYYGISYHHLPRSEDQPYQHVQWNGFQITPRDWTAESEIAN